MYPDDAEYYKDRADWLLSLGKFEHSLKDLSKTAKYSDPDNNTFYNTVKSHALLGLNRIDEAMTIFDNKLSNSPELKDDALAKIKEFKEYEEEHKIKLSDWYKGCLLSQSFLRSISMKDRPYEFVYIALEKRLQVL